MKRFISLLLIIVFCFTGCGTTAQEKAEVVTTVTEEIKNDSEQHEEVHEFSSEDNLKDIEDLGFSSLNDSKLLEYVKDNVYTSTVEKLDSENYFVENVDAIYISQEYIDELAYNSKENVYFGYTLSELEEQWGDKKYIFTVDDDGKTTVKAFEEYANEYDDAIKNVAIGTGVILVCVTVSVVSSGVGAPEVINAFFVAAAKDASIFALSSGTLGGAAEAVIGIIEGKSAEETLKDTALSASEGFKWGAIAGAVTGGAGEIKALKGATLNGLTMNEAAQIQKDSKYPLDIIKQMKSLDEYEMVYKKAGLYTKMVNGKLALVRDIDLDYVSKLSNGEEVTNLVRMQRGKPPVDPLTGKSYHLHHVNQDPNGTLAILTESEHLGNASILNTAGKSSEIDRSAFEKIKKHFWESLAKSLAK